MHQQQCTPTDTSDIDKMLHEQLGDISHTVMVLSGKGGVGKSTVAAHIASCIAQSGKKTGLLDIDFHGPSIPTMFGAQKHRAVAVNDKWTPFQKGNLKLMSVSFLVDNDAAVIWRGPMKISAMKELVARTDWGQLDYLIIDCPPGTGDEPLSACQIMKKPDGAVIVTTPQEVALADVRRSVTFCRQLDLPIIGIIENMSGYICPKCKETLDIFKKGGGERICKEENITFLGGIPIDPSIVHNGDNGVTETGGDMTKILGDTIKKIVSL